MSLSNLLLILIAIFLLLVGIVIFLFLVIRRSRRIAYTSDPAMPDADKQELAPVDFLQYASDVELRQSFRRALRVLKGHITGRDYRYRAPWYLLAGEAESGKSSLLDSNGLQVAISDAVESSNQQLNWYFFDDGVVVDVTGDFLLRPDKTANHRGWNTVLRLLQKHRPQRPLDGLVLTIPCTDLFGTAEELRERRLEIEHKANCLYKKLWQAQKILGMQLPVYVLVTKCDELTGFSSFCRQLPEKMHSQIFGWSNPSSLETAYEPTLVSEAFESLHRSISALQFEIYAERDEIEDVDDLFLFPPTLQSMRKALQVYLDTLFKQSAYHSSYLFRGLYFCGEATAETLPAALAMVQASDPLFPEPETTAASAAMVQRKPAFLRDLFKEKVFVEANLAQPISRVAFSRNRMTFAAQVLSIIIVVIGGGGLLISYASLAQRERQIFHFLNETKGDLEKAEAAASRNKRNGNGANGDAAQARAALQEQQFHSGETRLLTGMADMNANPFYSLFVPSSWFSNFNYRLETSMAAAFQYVIFESLRIDLERRGQTLLYAELAKGTAPEGLTNEEQTDPTANDEVDETNSRSPLDSSFELHVYLEELAEYRLNLERYGRLISNVNSLVDLRHVVNYLGHAPLPDNFDKENYLYRHAIMLARGTEIDSPRFYKEGAHRVGELIEDMYAASFDRQGAKYEHLADLAQAEALLSRPEYTWISTYVFDPHSPFHGMTVSTGVRELRNALQDLRRQEFMGRDPEDIREAPAADQRRYQHLVRRVLVWDQEPLRRAITLHDQYENFVETRSYERTEYLDSSVKHAARSRLKTRLSRLFRDARKYHAIAPSSEGSALRSSLITEIRGLQEAQPTLVRALQIATELGIDGELRLALSTQISYLLRGVYREFVSQQFYAMKHPDFSWWKGSQPVAHVAYDLATVDDLNGYLTLQRKNIAFLARDLAVPLLTFSAQENIHTQVGVNFDWNEILTDLDAFDNKQPGNPIATLETFIATEMDKVNVDSCSASLRLPSEGSRDYFLRIRNSLRGQFYRRCIELARIKSINDTLAALNNYREIEEAFNKSLSGGFPFTDLGTRPDYPDLDPWEMLKFFRLFDNNEKAAREALARSVDYGAAPQNATEFLDQVARVRQFFAPFMEKKQGPIYDFKVQFRVNTEQEIGANQIIDWKFDVGKKKFSHLSDDLEGRWVFGDPIRLTLRWANNSPVVPVTGATPANVKAKDRIAVFEYTDNWSLFTLLIKHGAMLKRVGTLAECDQSFDADPYTLKFVVRTDPDPAAQLSQRAELKSADAQVFMRISLVTANKQEPLLLPCFPRKAPPVPVLFAVTGSKEN